MDPANTDYRLLLGKSRSSLGAFELNFGEKELAVESLGKAFDLFESLSKQHPENPNYQYHAALTLMLMPTNHADSITENQIVEVQQTANSLMEKSPRAEYVQLQIVSRLKLADFLLDQSKPQEAIVELKEAAKLYFVSDLKGAAEKSMMRAIGKTVGNVRQALPMPERREFMRFVEQNLREHFRRHFSRAHRRGPPGRGN